MLLNIVNLSIVSFRPPDAEDDPTLSPQKARDAKYVADGGFCGTPDLNGSRRRELLSFGTAKANCKKDVRKVSKY